jgi:hypothetical protein
MIKYFEALDRLSSDQIVRPQLELGSLKFVWNRDPEIRPPKEQRRGPP